MEFLYSSNRLKKNLILKQNSSTGLICHNPSLSQAHNLMMEMLFKHHHVHHFVEWEILYLTAKSKKQNKIKNIDSITAIMSHKRVFLVGGLCKCCTDDWCQENGDNTFNENVQATVCLVTVVLQEQTPWVVLSMVLREAQTSAYPVLTHDERF